MLCWQWQSQPFKQSPVLIHHVVLPRGEKLFPNCHPVWRSKFSPVRGSSIHSNYASDGGPHWNQIKASPIKALPWRPLISPSPLSFSPWNGLCSKQPPVWFFEWNTGISNLLGRCSKWEASPWLPNGMQQPCRWIRGICSSGSFSFSFAHQAGAISTLNSASASFLWQIPVLSVSHIRLHPPFPPLYPTHLVFIAAIFPGLFALILKLIEPSYKLSL